MIAVRQGSLEHDRLDPFSPRDPLPTAADLAHFFSDLAPGDPRLLIVELAGQMIGWGRVSRWTEEDGTHVYLHLAYLLPGWRGQGIGAAMIHWGEGLACEQAASLPLDAHAVLATNAAISEREKTAALGLLGYGVVRRLCEMRTDDLTTAARRELVLPAGTETRPVSPAQYRAIHAMFRDAWAGLFGTLADDAAEYEEFLDDLVRVPESDPTLWRVAWHGGEAVGAVVGRLAQGQGYVDYVATRKAWQHQGIASALLAGVLYAFSERGLTVARLYTDAENGQGAKTLYERAGFRATNEHILYRKPIQGTAVASDLPF
jgi:ribosomal protein S18 acetylase RimI-like enzyme